MRFFGSDVRIFFLFDATRNTDRFEDKAVVQDRIELLRGIVAAHLTMVNAIIGGGGSCDFPTDRVGLMSILLTLYSGLLLQLLLLPLLVIPTAAVSSSSVSKHSN